MHGARERVPAVDEVALDQFGERLLERERSVLARDRDFLMQVLQRVLPDVLAGAVAHEQQLRRRNQSATGLRHQRLRQDARERHCQLLSDRVLTLERK
jgi:hypothetical protein